jgi:hypothetical protein
MITFIKIVHTAVWGIMTTAVFYVGYSVFWMKFNEPFFISLALIVTEILVILVNSWRCPLTAIARRYTSEEAPNFDIFLPRIIAKYNKEIFSVILSLILIVYIYNSIK